MSTKTREEQLVLEGTAYDNFINAVRSKSSQKFYLIGLKKFMAYNRIQNVSDMLEGDQRLIEAKIISWLVNMRDKESLTYITIQSYLSAVMTFYKMNDIEPRRHKINCYLPEERKANDDRATIDIDNNDNIYTGAKRHFLICNSCFWCVSLYSDSKTVKCPTCNSYSNLESIPLSKNESFKFNYHSTTGIALEFLQH
jgi:hypothetical protein